MNNFEIYSTNKELHKDIHEPRREKLHEECGLFGMLCEEEGAFPALDAYNALFALQHRGQDSAGIAVSDGKKLRYKKGDGLVPDVFDDKSLSALSGNIAIGHVRYATYKGTSGINAQPIVVKHISGQLALAFNGNLTNAKKLREDIELSGGIFQTHGHAEIITYIIVRALLQTGSIEEAVIHAVKCLEGAFCLILMTEDKLIAVRDPHGFRPLCLGRTGCNDVVIASETCALDAVGAVYLRDIEPGEVLAAKRGGEISSRIASQSLKKSLCVFEYIYFARPDSVIDGLSVEKARQEAGRCLAESDNISADVVIGVPDSGLSAALGYSIASGIPYDKGLVKNRYIARTFIQPTQGQRERAVKIKLNALSASVSGKRVVMIDDSIVRGTTCARIVSILREAGAIEVHMRVSSPPFLYPCYFGTDIASRDELIANNHTIEEIREIIGVDSLKYLAIQDLSKIALGAKCDICHACFSGDYSIPVNEVLKKESEER